MLNTLKILLYPPHHNPDAMGSNTYNNIILYITNIYNKHHSSFNELVRGINRTYLIEFICSVFTEGKWTIDGILNKEIPCFDRLDCPINIIIEYGMFMLEGFFE